MTGTDGDPDPAPDLDSDPSSDADSGGDPVPAVLHERYGRVEVLDELHDVPPNEVHLVRVDGRRAVLKRSTDPRGDAGVEGRAGRLADRETSLGVPEVLWVGDRAHLAAFDPEAPDPESATATDEWCRAAGRGLAELHSVTFDRHGLLAVDGDPSDPDAGLQVDADPGATAADGLDDLLEVFRDSVADAGYAGVVDDARAFVRDHADRFAGVEPVLVHGWFSPEHVAVGDGATGDRGTAGDDGVGDGSVRSVVDFEHAMAGPAEYDVWRAAIPTFGPWKGGPDDPEGWATFRDAYESVRPLPGGFEARADAYRTLVAVSYLDSLVTQRGIESNRDRADAIGEFVAEALAGLRERWG